MLRRGKFIAEHRAAPVRVPSASTAVVEERAQAEARLKVAEREERRRLMRMLIVLAVVVLLASIVRAGWDRVFVPGWWRLW